MPFGYMRKSYDDVVYQGGRGYAGLPEGDAWPPPEKPLEVELHEFVEKWARPRARSEDH